uniref:hypothetical protein n=1 Tax=Roseivirga sp. TaxID=1964215 RepID=UPI004048E389
MAAYFIQKYADPKTRVISFRGKNPFSNLIYCGLTSHFVDKLDEVPFSMREIKIKLTSKYKHLYIDQHKAFDIAAVLEFWFWKDAGIEVLNAIHQTGNMQKGIDQFYDTYALSDEIYDRDNFRKQLQRNGVVCPKDVYPIPVKRESTPKVTPAMAIHLNRLYASGKFTLRDLGAEFDLGPQTVMRHINKVKEMKLQKNA